MAPPFKRRELPEALPIFIRRVRADFASWTGVSSCQKAAICLARARLAATGSGSAGRVKQQPAIKRRSPYRFEWQFIRKRQTVTDDMNVFAHNSNKGGAIRSEEFNRSLILHP
jgi:hypothetical protein